MAYPKNEVPWRALVAKKVKAAERAEVRAGALRREAAEMEQRGGFYAVTATATASTKARND